jgi:hypothetical protein
MANLPAQLEHVPEEQRLPEALGIGFAGVGAGALIVFIGHAVQLATTGLTGDTWKFAAGSAAVAVAGIVIELLRRRKPLTLVPQEHEVGVYREGQLVSTFPMNQLTLYRLSWANTFREMILFGMFGAFATLGALLSLVSGPLGLYTAWVWGVAIALDALAYSSVLTRLMSKQYYLPSGASGAVAFRKSALQRVGWRHS